MKLNIIVAGLMIAVILTACLPKSETQPEPAAPQEAQQAEEPSIESIEQDINAQELDEIDQEVEQLNIE